MDVNELVRVECAMDVCEKAAVEVGFNDADDTEDVGIIQAGVKGCVCAAGKSVNKNTIVGDVVAGAYVADGGENALFVLFL